jgi:hypothetical protein
MSAAWAWAGARVAGTSHLKHGLPCQDSFACRVWRQGDKPSVLIAALADGAGSAERAEVGSALACSLFVEIVCERFETGAAADSFEAAMRYALAESRRALELKAGHDGRDVADYASTFLAAILSPEGGVVGQIGDGAAVVGEGQGSWRPVHWPDHGEYANTTNFLTQPDALDLFRLAVLERPARRIALFSDGLERLVLDFRDHSAHGPFFDSIFARMCQGGEAGHLVDVSHEFEALLASDRVSARTDDDKSLLCAALMDP